MPRIRILGVPIDALTRKEAQIVLLQMLSQEKQKYVVTPNNEILLEAHRNERLKDALQRADLALPDSTGLVWAARFTGQYLPQRVTGVDTVTALCKELNADHPVFLLGAAEGIAEKAAAALKKENPKLVIAGTYSGSPSEQETDEIISIINRAQPHLLLVAFGAPAQELWIAKNLTLLPSVRVAIGVGGTFDFLAGKRKRAPRILRIVGLEWLWRLMWEPWRIGRILRAVLVFPLLVLFRGKGR